MGETKLGSLARAEMLDRSILAESGRIQGDGSTLEYERKRSGGPPISYSRNTPLPGKSINHKERRAPKNRLGRLNISKSLVTRYSSLPIMNPEISTSSSEQFTQGIPEGSPELDAMWRKFHLDDDGKKTVKEWLNQIGNSKKPNNSRTYDPSPQEEARLEQDPNETPEHLIKGDPDGMVSFDELLKQIQRFPEDKDKILEEYDERMRS